MRYPLRAEPGFCLTKSFAWLDCRVWLLRLVRNVQRLAFLTGRKQTNYATNKPRERLRKRKKPSKRETSARRVNADVAEITVNGGGEWFTFLRS